jgi:hypothetical protein
MSVGLLGRKRRSVIRPIERLGDFLDAAIGRAVPTIGLGHDRSHAPEKLLWSLYRLSLRILYQVAAFRGPFAR